MSHKLIAVETHPIQYKAPLFRMLASRPDLELKVLYAMIPDTIQQGAGFGVSFAWDVPLLEGYPHEVLENVSPDPSVTRFAGCDTPGIDGVLKRERPGAVLVNGWVVKTCLQVLWACRRLEIPCLVRGEANLLRPRAWWKHVLHRLLLRQYQGWLPIGSANRAFYRYHRCRESHMFPAPYAVDNDRFSADAAARAGTRDALRESFGIPTDAVVFLLCGKLEPKKHPMDVLQALQNLSAFRFHPSSLSPFLLIVGDGPLRRECEGYAAEHHLPVEFAGFLNQSRLPDAYAAADVLVLPSDAGETWGLVVNEAMASGRPVIVSRKAGCCDDLVIDGATGFAFDCGDLGGLARQMVRYLEDPGLSARQGLAAARHIENFGLKQAADGIVAAVKAVGRGC